MSGNVTILGGQVVTEDWLIDVQRGNVPNWRVEHKFGRAVVGTTFSPVSFGGVWNTPQPVSAELVRIRAGATADASGGTGAWEVTLQGLTSTGDVLSATLTPNGAAASNPTDVPIMRLRRFYVSKSGTYATQSQGSHDADIVVENSAGSAWGTIDSSDFPRGQSEIADFTTASNETAYILEVGATVDTSKTTDLLLLQRRNILDAAPPYQAARLIVNFTGLKSDLSRQYRAPLGPYPPLTDIGFMARVSGTTSTTEVSVRFLINTT